MERFTFTKSWKFLGQGFPCVRKERQRTKPSSPPCAAVIAAYIRPRGGRETRRFPSFSALSSPQERLVTPQGLQADEVDQGTPGMGSLVMASESILMGRGSVREPLFPGYQSRSPSSETPSSPRATSLPKPGFHSPVSRTPPQGCLDRRGGLLSSSFQRGLGWHTPP